ncbi:MAG: hypothetical protein ABI706_11210 [Ilumatobacteraceae bacterium]
MNDTRSVRRLRNPNAPTVAAWLVAVIAPVWTLAAFLTLAYWSGLLFWIAVVIAIGAFVWTVRVYLAPTQSRESLMDR